jgi:hypothetical protein
MSSMKRFFKQKRILSLLLACATATGFALGLLVNGGAISHAASLPYTSMDAYVKFVQAHHKAPFEQGSTHGLSAQAAQALVKNASLHVAPPVSTTTTTNVKVNQDRNPWPKAEVAAAIDPTNGNNYVVMANDFRENFDHEFYHSSTDGGNHWTDDSMVGGFDFYTQAQLSFQSDPGVAFDTYGDVFLSALTVNQIFDNFSGYENLDTQVEVTTAPSHGTYTSLEPTVVDTVPCEGTFTSFFCPGSLDKPLMTVDTVKNSPNLGTIYVYYTYFCNFNSTNTPCSDGNATIPAGSSAILVASAPGPGGTFSSPDLASGSLTQAQFSDLVVDSKGTPHLFFDDFSSFPTAMYESTPTNGTWTVNPTPVAQFAYNGVGNPIQWSFRDDGSQAPGCGIWGTTAYCAFDANEIGNGPTANTASVFLAVVNTKTGASTINRVNNDSFYDAKHHFFPWATADAKGVYVGWYDDRLDPFNARVNYYVGKSTDGGKTFPTQKAVSSVAFDPCTGFPGCSFFGDYTQLVAGPDNVVHAAWSDTRDGVSMQIWSQSITW